MIRSSLLPFAIALLTLGAVGCTNDAAPSEDESTEVSADELRTIRIRTRMANVIGVDEDGTHQIQYSPDVANAYVEGRPAFEAVPFTAEPGGVLEVSVGGDFPSNAQVVVIDASYRVVRTGRTTDASQGLAPRANQFGQRASLTVISAPPSGFVLVRDLRWVRPMQFGVRVAATGS